MSRVPVEPLGPDADDLRAVVADGRVGVVFQPIVDVRRSVVVGYEALGRIEEDDRGHDISDWLEAAHALGQGARFESLLIEAALDSRETLPLNCFLSINATPAALVSSEIRSLLGGQSDLRGLMIEITEQEREADTAALAMACERFRTAGAMIAVDDLGAGFAGLNRLHQLRPQLLKFDRELIENLDDDPAKRIVIETIGLAADRLDAWVLAEGVERSDELTAIARLGVPLAQGNFLGAPAPGWSDITPQADATLRSAEAARSYPNLGPLIERAAWVGVPGDALPAELETGDIHVLCDDAMRPLGVAVDASLPFVVQRCEPAGVDDSPQQVLARMMARPATTRYSPVVVIDPAGRYLGVVKVDRLIATVLDES